MMQSANNSKPKPPAENAVAELLQSVISGNGPASQRLRAEVLDFCFDPSARTVFLSGEIGAGKSTIARAIAFCKRLAWLDLHEAMRLISDVRYTGPGLIDERLMDWYVEVPLTGVVETLAETQLFGVIKGAFTDAKQDRMGVFESVTLGRSGIESPAVKVTGGIVFLDEIAELTPQIQAKLLPVLSGGVYHRVGGDKDLSFHGVTIAASWRGLQNLRPDLVSRIADRVIHVPSIADRREDLPEIIDGLQTHIIDGHRKRIRSISVDQTVSRYWVLQADRLQKLDRDSIAKLADVDWRVFGNLRGLSTAVRQLIFTTADIETVLARLQALERPLADGDSSLLSELLSRSADGNGLATHVRQIELRRRTDLRETLLGDEHTLLRVSQQLDIKAENLHTQAKQLNRSRSKRKKKASLLQ